MERSDIRDLSEPQSHPACHCAPCGLSVGLNFRAAVVEVSAALLRLEITLDVAERVHLPAQTLADELVELDRLRQREVAPHLHRDLVALERGCVAGGKVARERDGVRLELGGGNRLADDAERIGLLARNVAAAERDQRELLHRQAGMEERRG